MFLSFSVLPNTGEDGVVTFATLVVFPSRVTLIIWFPLSSATYKFPSGPNEKSSGLPSVGYHR